MKRFVVLATQRSGSTLLRTSLDSHPAVVCRDEVFLFRHDQAGVPGTFIGHVHASPVRRFAFEHVPGARDVIVRSFLRGLYDVPAGVEAAGFKLMYNHVRAFPAIAPWLERHAAAVVHMIRRNTLKTLLSHQTKDTRGVTHSTNPVAPVRVVVDCERMLRKLESWDRKIARARERFSGRFEYMEITYEDLVADRPRELGRVLDFLGVGERPELRSDLVKLNPDAVQEIVENYDELAQALRGTPWERLLGDGRAPA